MKKASKIHNGQDLQISIPESDSKVSDGEAVKLEVKREHSKLILKFSEGRIPFFSGKLACGLSKISALTFVMTY